MIQNNLLIILLIDYFIQRKFQRNFLKLVKELEPWHGYNDMKAFIEGEEDPKLKNALLRSIQRKEAFSRFKAYQKITRKRLKSGITLRHSNNLVVFKIGCLLKVIVLKFFKNEIYYDFCSLFFHHLEPLDSGW